MLWKSGCLWKLCQPSKKSIFSIEAILSSAKLNACQHFLPNKPDLSMNGASKNNKKSLLPLNRAMPVWIQSTSHWHNYKMFMCPVFVPLSARACECLWGFLCICLCKHPYVTHQHCMNFTLRLSCQWRAAPRLIPVHAIDIQSVYVSNVGHMDTCAKQRR